MARFAVVAPRRGAPSGGSAYDARVAAEAGAPLVEVPGDWPHAAPADEARLADVVATLGREHDAVVVDGLVGCAAPDVVEQAVGSGTRLWLLVHLPLPAETGLAAGERDRLAAAEGRALRGATGVLCTGEWARADLAERYAVDAVVVAPGVDPAPPAAGSAGTGTPLLLTVASLTPRKNHATLLAALGGLRDLPWHAAWVGPPGPGSSRLLAEVADSPVGPRVEVTGAREGEVLREWWHRADLLVLPSLAETYAMVVTEALSRGVPAVVGAGAAATTLASAGAAGPGVLSGVLPGVVVDPADTDALRNVLRRWLTDDATRSAWRAAALARRPGLTGWGTTAAGLVAALSR